MPRVLTALALLAVAASGQWSEPVTVPCGPTWRNCDFVVGPGDTVWALWTVGSFDWDSAVAYASWSLGDSWSAPESIDCTELAACATAGVDGEGRIWFLRYDGDVPLLTRDHTGYLVASVRERTGWRNLPHVLCCGGSPVRSADELDFATDRNGQPWLGINEHVHEGLVQYCSARFGRLQGDTCTWPAYVMKGDSEHWVDGPLLEPRPDSGMWSACQKRGGNGNGGVHVHVLRGDSAYLLHDFGWWPGGTAVDSSGNFWVVYFDTLWQLWSAKVGLDSTIVHRLITSIPADFETSEPVCADNEGWVWCGWPGHDSTMFVSWNRGDTWSQPERATGGARDYSHLVSDSHGRVYLFYGSLGGPWYGVHRLSRPGIQETVNDGRRTTNAGPTIARDVLLLPEARSERREARSELLDAAGRRVMNLVPGENDVRRVSPGVYFVREQPQAASPKPQAIQKVVIAR